MNRHDCKTLAALAALSLLMGGAARQAAAHGKIDPGTVVSAPHGSFNGIAYRRYEAMFVGVTSKNRRYRVPCQVIAPQDPGTGSGLLLFDWLVQSTVVTVVGQEQADARYTMTDAFLFGRGHAYATVRADQSCIGMRSPVSNPFRPWSDGLLNVTDEVIPSAADEFEIVADYVKALRTDPTARQLLGRVRRTAAFGYSASGARLRGLLRLPLGRGLFDFSLVGGTGVGYLYPEGDGLAASTIERAPREGAGREIDFQSETDVLAFDGYKTRHEEANYRLYQFAGSAHIRSRDAAEFHLASPETANPADWTPFFRGLFVAGEQWCDGATPPASLWLGAPNDPEIARDAKGNALVRFVGTKPVATDAYRLPEVAVGENQYIPLDPSFADGTFLGLFRMIAGGHVDLTSTIHDHASYVAQTTWHALTLVRKRYLLLADAGALIQRAVEAPIGQ